MKKFNGFTLAEGATHVVHWDNTCKKAFTLAEVLITLGIIGIVAALTMPTLIGNATATRYKTHFKKTLSVLNQAVKLSAANDDIDFATDWEYGDGLCPMETVLTKNVKGITNVKSEYREKYEKNWTEFLSVLTGHDYIYGDFYLAYLMPDGALFASDNSTCSLPEGMSVRDFLLTEDIEGRNNFCIGFIDVNGFNPPNKEVTCADGTVSGDIDEACTLAKDKINDIFPVVYFNQTVVPATNAAKAALIQ